MNTSKQVNAMIGLMLVVVIIFAANVFNEPNRAETAREHQIETFATRGAEIFVANCRSCHGLEGLGLEEGAIGPALNSSAYLILGEGNGYGVDETPAGVAEGIRTFLGDSIACGRKGTAMPVWSEHFGGSLSDQQIDYLVTLITEGRWDIVEEVAHEHDSHLDPVPTRDDILSDGSGVAITKENCGQYDGLTARPFRERDPFAGMSSGDGDGTAEPTATAEPGGGGPADAMVQGLPIADYFLVSCSACHGANRAGIPGVGLPLTPDVLTEPDEFYFDTIKDGRAGTVMPPWGSQGLTDDDINALVQWIKNVEP
ncbi:MAG: cytochrome c [Dehalococcoidia bacterium]|jgi:mono/diheme cytochrome c family protein|nr:cytochrome c [Dehalococcoidia bacterium]